MSADTRDPSPLPGLAEEEDNSNNNDQQPPHTLACHELNAAPFLTSGRLNASYTVCIILKQQRALCATAVHTPPSAVFRLGFSLTRTVSVVRIFPPVIGGSIMTGGDGKGASQ